MPRSPSRYRHGVTSRSTARRAANHRVRTARADRVDADDEAVIEAWGFVVEAYSAVNERAAARLDERFDLPAPWFEVLLRLVRSSEGRMPMTQLAREVSFSSSGFTKLADHLQAAGLVERTPCAVDRRVTWLTITPAGRDRVVPAMADQAEFLRSEVVAAVGSAAFERLSATMHRLRDALGAGGASRPPA